MSVSLEQRFLSIGEHFFIYTMVQEVFNRHRELEGRNMKTSSESLVAHA